MNPVQPRITRRELRQLIRQRSWAQLRRRLEQVPSEDVAAHLPGLQPEQQRIVHSIMSRRQT